MSKSSAAQGSPSAALSYLELLGRFEGLRIGLIGDMMADVYILGRPTRLSREAPVLVVTWEGESTIPGGAANTVANLASLSAQVSPVSVLGDDGPGRALLQTLDGAGVDTSGILLRDDFGTVTKTRLMVGDTNRTKQQAIRVDREPQRHPPEEVVEAILTHLDRLDRTVDAWLVSDYDYGVVSDEVALRLSAIAKEKPVVVDSRQRLPLFEGVTLLTPNEEEALEMAPREATGARVDDPAAAGRALLEAVSPQAVLVTRGKRGMVLLEKGGREVSFPVVGADEAVDVSGAGDTVAATACLALVAGGTMEQAARLANLAASVVVMKTGAATCSRQELVDRLGLL